MLTSPVGAHDARAGGVAVAEAVAAGRHQRMVPAHRAVLHLAAVVVVRRIPLRSLDAGLDVVLVEKTHERDSSVHLEVVVDVAAGPGEVVLPIAEAPKRGVDVELGQRLHVTVGELLVGAAAVTGRLRPLQCLSELVDVDGNLQLLAEADEHPAVVEVAGLLAGRNLHYAGGRAELGDQVVEDLDR